MARTTQSLVEGILMDQYDEPDDLDPFIDAANALVTKCCAGVASYDDGHLERIERWLAAHFYKVVKRQETQEQAGSVRVMYEGRVDLRLQVTEFGQQALILDWNCGLAALNNQAGKIVGGRVGLDYLGSDPE